MEVQVRDTIITDEYLTINKTDNIVKIAKKLVESPNGLVIIKQGKGKVLGVVTFKEIITSVLNKKDLSKLKLKDVLQKNYITVKETDNIDKVIKRIKRRNPIATIVVDDRDRLVGYFSNSDLSYADACKQLIDHLLK